MLMTFLRLLRSFQGVMAVALVWLLATAMALAFTKAEFKQKVSKGMSQAQVEAAVGKPDETNGRPPGITTWRYRKVYDSEAQGEVTAVVGFRNDAVMGVTFLAEEK